MHALGEDANAPAPLAVLGRDERKDVQEELIGLVRVSIDFVQGDLRAGSGLQPPVVPRAVAALHVGARFDELQLAQAVHGEDRPRKRERALRWRARQVGQHVRKRVRHRRAGAGVRAVHSDLFFF
ncbi:MAG: hypothetical protein CMM02_08025 [Rhodopirellula sp.]|nr:hypothetical protein [Rhodopirellula sp.]